MILIKLPSQEQENPNGFKTLQEAINFANTQGYNGNSEKVLTEQGIEFSVPKLQTRRNFLLMIEKGTKSNIILSFEIAEVVGNELEIHSLNIKLSIGIDRRSLDSKEKLIEEVRGTLIKNNLILKNEEINLTQITSTSPINFSFKKI